MEYFPHGTLEKRIHMEGTIDLKRVKIYAFQIFRALYYIHLKGISHRDIKSANMLMRNHKIVISDFGSAKSNQ